MNNSASSRPVIRKIVSGGQTGVDRAALDAAIALNIPCGGWCPQGRLAEDGPIDAKYPLMETPSADYAQRTEWNVRDSDGTLILTVGEPTGGTAFTLHMAEKHGKPIHIVRLDARATDEPIQGILDWLNANQVSALNIAGPRESTSPGIHSNAFRFIRQLLQ